MSLFLLCFILLQIFDTPIRSFANKELQTPASCEKNVFETERKAGAAALRFLPLQLASSPTALKVSSYV
jgi:hypothetical protein